MTQVKDVTETIRFGVFVVLALIGAGMAYAEIQSDIERNKQLLEEIYEWRNEWQKRVLPLDAVQDQKLMYFEERLERCCERPASKDDD